MNKWPETRSWKNAIINLRVFGARAPSHKLLRYPRERLLNSLPLLLWSDAGSSPQTPDPAVGRFLRRELMSDDDSPAALSVAYRTLWRRFN